MLGTGALPVPMRLSPCRKHRGDGLLRNTGAEDAVQRAAEMDLAMVEGARGRIEYDEGGMGPTVVLVAGSCSTGAAWRPVIEAWNNRFRCVTTSLLGYGGTAERRTASNPSIAYEAEVLEADIRRAGGRVQLVGHSFGGLVALAVALRKRVPLASLVIVEAPAAEILRYAREHQHYRALRRMTESYFAAFESGNLEAIA